jgi:hypothetical protein
LLPEKERAARAAPDELLARCGGQDAAGDGSGLFPHVAGVGVGACVPELLCGVVKDAGELGGRRGLAHQRASVTDEQSEELRA